MLRFTPKIVTGVYSLLFLKTPAWADDIRDIHPPVEFPSNYWPFIGLTVVFLASALGAAIYFVRWALTYRAIESQRLPPWEKALVRITDLEGQGLLVKGELKRYYSELSDVLRHYFEERFFIKAPDMTSEEFLRSLESSSYLSDAQNVRVKEFLHSCDMVKFAKSRPDLKEAEENLKMIKGLITETAVKKEEATA